MTAAVLYGKEDVKIEQVPIPTLEEGEVLVKVEVALTCGTDLKVYQRGYHARMIVPPALFGHELAGVIEEVGPNVKGFKKGMRVVALNSAPCGMCFYCSKHQENLCQDLLFNNGAYAEYIRIPRRIVESNMLAIPKHISYEEAAIVEPLACVLRGLHETKLEIGDTVAVIGAGPIGLMFVQVAKLSGCNVISVVKRDSQVAAARHAGADSVVQITTVDDPVKAVRKIFRHSERPFAVDAATLRRDDDPPDYISFREAAINLLIHQDFGDTTRLPVIRFFRDQTEFFNPGRRLRLARATARSR